MTCFIYKALCRDTVNDVLYFFCVSRHLKHATSTQQLKQSCNRAVAASSMQKVGTLTWVSIYMCVCVCVCIYAYKDIIHTFHAHVLFDCIEQ